MQRFFILVVEGRTDARRLLRLLREVVPDSVQCGGLTTGEFTPVKDIVKLAKELGLPNTYGKGNSGDLRNIQKAVQVARMLVNRGELPAGHGLVWGRDTDDDPERAAAAAAVREKLSPAHAPLIRAVAHTCGEAWPIAGATHPGAAKARAALHKELNFDPVKEPSRLTAKATGARPGAKDVLERLTDADPDTEAECLLRAWASAMTEPSPVHTGLRTFREDLEALLQP
jgi:hypothetical protein